MIKNRCKQQQKEKEREKERTNERKNGGRNNQSPKGIMRSAVPLPCLSDVVKSKKVAGQRFQKGTKSARMGTNFI